VVKQPLQPTIMKTINHLVLFALLAIVAPSAAEDGPPSCNVDTDCPPVNCFVAPCPEVRCADGTCHVELDPVVVMPDVDGGGECTTTEDCPVIQCFAAPCDQFTCDADVGKCVKVTPDADSGTGVSCGSNVCTVGEYCCNASCGICAEQGMMCIQQYCGDDTPADTPKVTDSTSKSNDSKSNDSKSNDSKPKDSKSNDGKKSRKSKPRLRGKEKKSHKESGSN